MHVITRLGLGGAERVAETIATSMTAQGTASLIVPVAGTRDDAMASAMIHNLERHGVEVAQGGRSPTARVAAFQAVGALARTIEGWRPDVVHLHTEIPEFTWALATYRSSGVRRVPIVRTIHNTILWGGWGFAGRFAERRLDGAAVAAVSHAASDAFIAWRGAKLDERHRPTVIYNGVADLGPSRRPRGRKRPVLCFAGRFEPQKGIDTVLDAIGMVERPYLLKIFGSGSLQGLVTDAADARPGRIAVSEPVPDLRHRFGEFDAMLMPSRFEGLSIMAVEALLAAIPLLATDAPGLNEAMPDWYPGRCPPDDPVAFARLIDQFLADPRAWTEPGARARLWAADRFSLETMVSRYAALYDATIERAGTSGRAGRAAT